MKGNQVAPAELEALLLEHPAIADVAVIGAFMCVFPEIYAIFVLLAARESYSCCYRLWLLYW